jgi:hypothetical protein
MKVFVLMMSITFPWGESREYEAAQFYPAVLAEQSCEIAGEAMAADLEQRIAEFFGWGVEVSSRCEETRI